MFKKDTTGLVVDQTLADSVAIDCNGAVQGRIIVPTGQTLTAIAWYGCQTAGGTFLPLYDEFGNAVSLSITAARSYQVPTGAFGASWWKLVATGADGAVDVTLNFPFGPRE